MSWHHATQKGLLVKPGQYVECVKLGRINKLTLGKRYKVRDGSGRWFKQDFNSPSIRIHLECDDGIVRSFNTWNFRICEDQTESPPSPCAKSTHSVPPPTATVVATSLSQAKRFTSLGVRFRYAGESKEKS